MKRFQIHFRDNTKLVAFGDSLKQVLEPLFRGKGIPKIARIKVTAAIH